MEGTFLFKKKDIYLSIWSIVFLFFFKRSGIHRTKPTGNVLFKKLLIIPWNKTVIQQKKDNTHKGS